MGNPRNLNDDLFDAAIMEALRQLEQEEELEAERLLDSLREEAAAITPSKKFQENMRYLCRKAGKRKAPAKIYPRAMRIAAMFAVVVAIGAVGALGVDAYWDSLFGWVLRQNSVYTLLEPEDAAVNKCNATIFGNTDWDHYYLPEAIPKDFQLEDVEARSMSAQISFVLDEQAIELRLIPIHEKMQYSAGFDTEGTRGFQKVKLGDYECYYVKKTYPGNIRIIQVICNNGDFWIEFIFRNLSQRKAFPIVESLTKIERQ